MVSSTPCATTTSGRSRGPVAQRFVKSSRRNLMVQSPGEGRTVLQQAELFSDEWSYRLRSEPAPTRRGKEVGYARPRRRVERAADAVRDPRVSGGRPGAGRGSGEDHSGRRLRLRPAHVAGRDPALSTSAGRARARDDRRRCQAGPKPNDRYAGAPP